MTPHEYQLAIYLLAALGAALFLLGRYLWPSNRGLAAQFDQEYQAGRDDQRHYDRIEVDTLNREKAWLEVQLVNADQREYDSLHPRYEVLSPAALDAVNSLPGPVTHSGLEPSQMRTAGGAGEFHDDDWPTDYRLSPALGLGQPGDGTPATYGRWKALHADFMWAFYRERDELDRELVAA